MSRALQNSLAALALLAAASVVAFACTSGDDGNIGNPCQSTNDCAAPFVCLDVDDAGTCASGASPEGGIGISCQLPCQGDSDCMIAGANYVCNFNLETCAIASGERGVCQPMAATQ
jgi:hypothetical protein